MEHITRGILLFINITYSVVFRISHKLSITIVGVLDSPLIFIFYILHNPLPTCIWLSFRACMNFDTKITSNAILYLLQVE